MKEYQIYCMHWILHLEYRIYNLGYNRHISIVNHINRNLFILFCDLGCIHTNCINGNSDPVFGIQILSIGTWILFGIQITSIGCWIIFWDTNYVIAMGTWILFGIQITSIGTWILFGIQITSIGTWILFGIQITSIGTWILFGIQITAMGTWILLWDTNCVNRKLNPYKLRQ